MAYPLTEAFLKECKMRLLDLRSDLLNRVRATRLELSSLNSGSGDEADQTVTILAEQSVLIEQSRWQQRLLEIDYALKRMELGVYGICEETEEPIEMERLRSIPWTRLSIEGAEFREAQRSRSSGL